MDVVDRDVDDALARSFPAGLPAELTGRLRAEGDRADYPAGTTAYRAGDDVPLVMAQGRLDQVAPGEAAERFYDSLTAPSKELVWFSKSAHTETGTTTAFAPARAQYHSAGFTSCGPFAGYRPSEDIMFMSLKLAAPPE